MRSIRCLALAMLLALMAAGCAAQTKTYQMTATPPDAEFSIDGVPSGRGPIRREFTFDTSRPSHRVAVTRLGYDDEVLVISPNSKPRIDVKLAKKHRDVFFTVQPAPAVLTIDGKPVNDGEPVQNYSTRLEFTVDNRNVWTSYVVRAERANYQPAEIVISWPDRGPQYTLNLEPMRKDIAISSEPSGATVYIDDQKIGTTPMLDKGREFPVDPATNEFIPRKLKVVKPGYEPIEKEITWDNAASEYRIDLQAKTKTVRISTEPRDAIVEIDGQPLKRDASGVAKMQLQFPPINDAGDLKTYNVTVSKAATTDGEWEPAKLVIGWDGGKTDYPVKLKEILSRPIALLTAKWTHDGQQWLVEPKEITTIAMKDVGEGPDRPRPVLLSQLPKGTSIDTLAVSPDGSRVLFTVLAKDKDAFRSQMYVVRTDGSGGTDLFSDGKSLDLTPSFTPGGEDIVFASNRAGRKLSIWRMAASGAPGITQLTNGEANDLYPAVDSDPRPRLFYQSMLDLRSDPRLFSAQVGPTFRTDLQTTGMQPRVSPKNDVIVFTSINDKTGKRDLYRMPAAGGSPQNLTGTADVDEFDPVWNANGTKLAFASDAGVDADNRHNFDIWILDLTKDEGPKQLTTNGSHDDCPAWDPSGNAIYFRSNRGGQWGIWKLSIN